MKYLGVSIPKETDKIIQLNYGPLISRFKSDLARWNLVPFLGVAQRVEAIKMNLLP